MAPFKISFKALRLIVVVYEVDEEMHSNYLYICSGYLSNCFDKKKVIKYRLMFPHSGLSETDARHFSGGSVVR